MLRSVDDAADANGLRDGNDPCDPIATFDTVAVPHSRTIDFGTVNCTAANGRTRRGVINVSFTGRYRNAGTVNTITPQNYYVNDDHVQSTRNTNNTGLNNDGHPCSSVNVNGTLTAGDGSWTASHQAQRTQIWTEGSSTLNLLDDVHLITGSGAGVNCNGTAYTTTITQALRVALGC